jgi:8-oxo-dGTP diphosphatase
MNAFETGARKSIPAVLVYARSGSRVLMIHRNAHGDRPGDYHSGKWNGLGGKCEAGESPQETARREFEEEAGVGLPLGSFLPLGVLTFPNFKALKHEDWTVFVFTSELSDSDCSAVLARNDEGALHWVEVDDLLTLNLWPGDRYFIPYLATRRPFIGTIWYQGQQVLRHWVQGLG